MPPCKPSDIMNGTDFNQSIIALVSGCKGFECGLNVSGKFRFKSKVLALFLKKNHGFA